MARIRWPIQSRRWSSATASVTRRRSSRRTARRSASTSTRVSRASPRRRSTPGAATQRHYHARSEEIYLIVEGGGELEVDGERRQVGPGDAVLIPPQAWHELTAGEDGVRLLCCCVPPYADDDTFFA